MNNFQSQEPIREVEGFSLRRHWGWFLLFGIGLIVLGSIAISLSAVTTVVSVVMLGIFITIGGAVITIDTFRSWWGQWRNFYFYLVMGLLYLTVGIMLIKQPIMGAVTLTFLLATFYIILGIFRIIVSVSLKQDLWGWNLFSGIIAFLLGFLILIGWPGSSMFIIGLFVGIDLLFAGWPYVLLGITGRSMSRVN